MNEKPSCMRDVINKPERHKLSSEIEQAVESFFKCHSLYHPGKACDELKTLLDTRFTITKPPVFVGDIEEGRRAHFSATVLYHVSREKCRTVSNSELHPIGWAGLHLEAKVWCRTMLQCEPPSNMTTPAICELLQAKVMIGRLIAEAGTLPMTQPDPLIKITPKDYLEAGIPIDD